MNKVVINNPHINLLILGLLRQLKWGQLKELHAAIKLCSTTLVQKARTNFSFRSTTRGNVSKVFMFSHISLINTYFFIYS